MPNAQSARGTFTILSSSGLMIGYGEKNSVLLICIRKKLSFLVVVIRSYEWGPSKLVYLVAGRHLDLDRALFSRSQGCRLRISSSKELTPSAACKQGGGV